MNDKTEEKTTEIFLPVESGGAKRLTKLDTEVPGTSLIDIIGKVALTPGGDLAKLEKLMDLQERILNREEEKAFYADLAAMQPELPRVIKSKDGHNSKYAPLEDINDAIRPAMQKYGFAVIFNIEQKDKSVDITTTLAHKLGHTKSLTIPLALDTSGSKNAVQAVGSTISYGKRYGICAILNISTGDDVDGKLPEADEPDVTDWLSKIGESTDFEELKQNYKDAFNANSGYKGNQLKINSAKDDMKRKLTK